MQRNLPGPVAAIAMGLAFAFISVELSDYLAAVAMPAWYMASALRYPGVLFQVWNLVVAGLPLAMVAASCGYALSRLTGSSALSLPLVTLLVWALYWLLSPLDHLNLSPLATLSFWTYFTPWACLLAVGLLLGYHLALPARTRAPGGD